MKNKQILFKNIACLSFCLAMFFIASIFVSETYFNRIINQQIQDISLLKSFHYQDWGQQSAPSPVIHKFQPYTYDENGNATLFSQSLNYQYTFKYQNFSFTQGNTGNIRYLNTWKRQQINKTNQNVEQMKLNVFNVQAQKVYDYDYYAPDIRRFALTYNIVFDTLVKQYIPMFYAQYMYEYIFKNQTMVQSRIFDPMGIKPQAAAIIYSHKLYGMNTPENLAKWIKLGDQIQDNTIYTSEFYHQIAQQFKLTNDQIMYIVGPKSSIQGLLFAIKGAVTGRMNQVDSDFCSDSDDNFCTSEQMVLAQLSLGVLTKQTLFPTVKIDKALNELNVTLFDTIQYRQFCARRPDLKNCSGDTNSDALGFFGKKILLNYTEVEYIFKNLDNPAAIEQEYDIPDAGQAMIAYIKFLYTNTFNIASPKQKKQENNLINQEKQSKILNEGQNGFSIQQFKRSFTNYNHFQLIMDRFQQILFVQLYTRAFFNNFINITQPPKCQDYYTKDFQDNKEDCAKLPLSNLSDVRLYMKTFLGIDSEIFMNQTTIQGQKLYSFFYNSDKSHFAQQALQLAIDIKNHYGCPNLICTKEQLLHRQWKDGSILTNLPTNKNYFPSKQQSISNWDYNNTLKGVEPQLFKQITVNNQVDPNQILNSNTGIYSLFNLMKVYNKKDQSTYSGITNRDLLYYLQTVVLKVQFNGVYAQQTITEFFNNHQSQVIQQKRQMDPQLGGAPWLSPYISVLKTQNNPQSFNYINSGIYDSQKLRSISMIQNQLYSSSVYTVYQSDWEDVEVTFTSTNKVKGTDLFGFQTKIQQHDTIEGYFDIIYQSQVLNYKNSQVWKNSKSQQIDAFRFGIDGSKKFQVTIQQLTNKTVQMSSESYFIVQPNTGLTLQMYIKYTVYSQPFYTQYLNSSSSSFPLYQGEVFYVRSNTDKIVQINKDKHLLNVLFLLGIIFSSLFIVGFVVMFILYRRAIKSNKFREENKSLISKEASSGVGETLEQIKEQIKQN